MEYKKIKGYSLVEVLVAMLIATTLMLAVVRLFTKVGETFEMNAEALQLMETTRVALKFVKSDLTQAGYMGCVQTDVELKGQQLEKLIGSIISLEPDNYWGVAGTDGGSGPDSLSLFYMQDLDIRVLTNDVIGQFLPRPGLLVDAYNVFDTSGKPVISEGDWLVVSNCEEATSFILTNTPTIVSSSFYGFGGIEDGITENTLTSLEYQNGISFDGYLNQEMMPSGSYNTSASGGATFVGRYFDVRYVVDDSVIDGGDTDSLFRLVNGEPPSETNEIVRFVEDFQVQFGVDTDSDGIADQFIQNIAQADENNKSVQVQISIKIAGQSRAQELVNMVKIRNKGL
jgi:type IV pilus assembly protein PilW